MALLPRRFAFGPHSDVGAPWPSGWPLRYNTIPPGNVRANAKPGGAGSRSGLRNQFTSAPLLSAISTACSPLLGTKTVRRSEYHATAGGSRSAETAITSASFTHPESASYIGHATGFANGFL